MPVHVCDPQHCLPPACWRGSLYCYRRWLAAHICVRVASLKLKASSGKCMETEVWEEREGRRSKGTQQKQKKQRKNTSEQVSVHVSVMVTCLLKLSVLCPTYTAGYGAVPLGQGVGNCQAFNGTRSLQHVTWTALKTDHSANSKVVPHTPTISGLRHWAALGGTGPWHSLGDTGWKMEWLQVNFRSLSVTFRRKNMYTHFCSFLFLTAISSQ